MGLRFQGLEAGEVREKAWEQAAGAAAENSYRTHRQEADSTLGMVRVLCSLKAFPE